MESNKDFKEGDVVRIIPDIPWNAMPHVRKRTGVVFTTPRKSSDSVSILWDGTKNPKYIFKKWVVKVMCELCDEFPVVNDEDGICKYCADDLVEQMINIQLGNVKTYSTEEIRRFAYK